MWGQERLGALAVSRVVSPVLVSELASRQAGLRARLAVVRPLVAALDWVCSGVSESLAAARVEWLVVVAMRRVSV